MQIDPPPSQQIPVIHLPRNRVAKDNIGSLQDQQNTIAELGRKTTVVRIKQAEPAILSWLENILRFCVKHKYALAIEAIVTNPELVALAADTKTTAALDGLRSCIKELILQAYKDGNESALSALLEVRFLTEKVEEMPAVARAMLEAEFRKEMREVVIKAIMMDPHVPGTQLQYEVLNSDICMSFSADEQLEFINAAIADWAGLTENTRDDLESKLTAITSSRSFKKAYETINPDSPSRQADENRISETIKKAIVDNAFTQEKDGIVIKHRLPSQLGIFMSNRETAHLLAKIVDDYEFNTKVDEKGVRLETPLGQTMFFERIMCSYTGKNPELRLASSAERASDNDRIKKLGDYIQENAGEILTGFTSMSTEVWTLRVQQAKERLAAR